MSHHEPALPVMLSKGANVGLRDLDAELGSLTVVLESRASADRPVDADVSVLLLGADGRVRTSDDLVFYNQPVALGGAVHLRDKITSSSDDDSVATTADVVTVELDDVPEDIQRIVVSASVDPSTGVTFGDAEAIAMRIQRSDDAVDIVEFRICDATTEAALLFGEFYRRAGEWRVRAVGQGYEEGLAALVADHGVDVDDEPQTEAEAEGDDDVAGPMVAAQPAADGATDAPADDQAAREPSPSAEGGAVGGAVGGADGAADDVDAPSAAAPRAAAAPTAPHIETPLAASEPKAVSVRRATRPPRLPHDWDASIPANDGTDWQPARLFPVAGIGGAEEQERRATSALLAVMSLVREFGRVLTARSGAPAGAVETFIEVPFGHEEEAYRPDGVIRVTRGQKQWTALVEVKTGDGRLSLEQVDHYVDIARAKGYDAVITISNELTGATSDHPLTIDRRKLRKLALVHLSWDQVRTEAMLLLRRRGIADATQLRVMDEFVRYMAHPRSGMHGFTDMGPQWVKVRDAVKAKTLRSGEKGAEEVSARFDQLVQHVGLQLSSALGVDVQALAPRNAPDAVSRCQQLADSGVLFGCLRVPGAVDVLVLSADLRTDRIGCSISIEAPREGRPLTRVNWLLRQLPDTTRDALRVEAQLAGGRGATTAQLLGALRESPDKLLSADGRDIKAFKLVLEGPMGAKRAAGSGGLIQSVRATTFSFYAEVVQNLRPWSARPPKLQ
jgi:stress response protein SCP2